MTDPDRSSDGDALRALLDDAVADVHPAPALDRIRARTEVTPMRRTRPWLLGTVGAVAATAATITVVALVDGRSPEVRPDSGPAAATTATPSKGSSGEPSSSPSAGTPTPSGSPSSSASPDSGAAPALPVYFVGDTPSGPRLFREFRPAPAGTGAENSARLLQALQLAVRGDAADPDYRSGWPPGVSVTGADWPGEAVQDPVLVVALGSDGDLGARPADMTEEQARLAVQQLVYTAQAVAQHRWPVRFTASDGLPLTRLLGLALPDRVAETEAMQVQAPVWVISPQDGQRVARSFTVEGRGAFFEANVSWQLLRDDGTVAEDGHATAEECCTLAPYSFRVSAPPGSYVLRVYDADVSGGEGPGEQQDTKRITVR